MFVEEGKRMSGDIRISAPDFELKEKSLNVDSNIDFLPIRESLRKTGAIFKDSARIKFGAMMFYGEEDERGLGFAVEEGDYDIIGFEHFIYEGRFLDFKSQNQILVGEKLRRYLNLNIGDEVTLLTSTQNGSISALNLHSLRILQDGQQQVKQKLLYHIIRRPISAGSRFKLHRIPYFFPK